MVRVAPINLAYNPRTLWFNPSGLEVHRGDAVVVDTARGTEFGTAAGDIMEVSRDRIKALKSPLRRIVRLATEEDVQRAREMEEKGREALPVFKQMAAEAHSDMHPVSVEFLLDGDKAIFYFEAEERVDFRDLVRKLASHFHVRIDMRQIGVRDEARIVGGLGHCGQELCCKRMGGDFNPVSIRMAKEQDLSLNPQKISGLCGRLMCCLRYEYEAYRDFKSRAPKVGATIDTPQGAAKVTELDVPREVVSLKVADEKPVKVPLADFDEADGGARPSSVGEEAWELASVRADMGTGGDPLTFITSQFTGTDKLAEAGSVRHAHGSGKGRKGNAGEGSSGGKSRSGRSGRGSKAGKGAKAGKAKGASRDASAASGATDEARKPRRRRSTKITSGEARGDAAHGKARKQEPKRASGESSSSGGSSRESESSARTKSGHARPGQKSSGLARGTGEGAKSKGSSSQKSDQGSRSRANAGSSQAKRGGSSKQPKSDARGKDPSSDAARASAGAAAADAAPHRRSRKRSHKAQGRDGAQGDQNQNQGQNQNQKGAE